ncbi:Post-GPI attachment to proteins factor 3 [Chionoecetes opilio]|uniref:Post-GPI attachment to proteins factor 3 n=1 Tax=Chionoecetes opilio TaxID=41210 RepID=A0A8J5CGA8_CHIOP|nr:Post-GPI attachment to proteins factor 3 [Chionoecetes opilio]
MLWTVLSVCLMVVATHASKGDTSNQYNGCYHICHFNNCTSNIGVAMYKSSQSLSEKMLQWTCDDECQYYCMWRTTQIFLGKGLDVPQFFGKVCINAWVWSVVFHARDTPWTERLDYFCAFSMVLFNLFGLMVRLLGPQRAYLRDGVAIAGLLFFTYHVWYLSKGRFDYGYNMKVNVLVGALNGFGWVSWSVPRLKTRPYVRWCMYTVVAAMASMLLELWDFPPLLWTFDAHALWHLVTAPLPFMWYRFLENDCLYLLQRASGPDYRKQI